MLVPGPLHGRGLKHIVVLSELEKKRNPACVFVHIRFCVRFFAKKKKSVLKMGPKQADRA